MEQFYIDRQFGQAIFIDVENGIVKKCYNEAEKFNARMNELYVGNTINFLKKDFIGRAMKGTYHHLRPMCITDAINKVDTFKTRIRHLNNEYSSLNTTKERQFEIKGQIKELEIQQYAAEKELTEEKERILNQHNFII
jgi:hypothetical protein